MHSLPAPIAATPRYIQQLAYHTTFVPTLVGKGCIRLHNQRTKTQDKKKFRPKPMIIMKLGTYLTLSFFHFQVLELGIVSHSIIIGLSLGVSQSPCTIRSLMGALSFHQFFEGFALGGCISQAQFTTFHSTLMACFFSITTPIGIAIGTSVSSFYNPNSPRALVIEGIFDSISAGILVYMALVDLIAADFLSKKMRCNLRLQLVSYFTLFLGAGLMSSLAIWAWLVSPSLFLYIFTGILV